MGDDRWECRDNQNNVSKKSASDGNHDGPVTTPVGIGKVATQEGSHVCPKGVDWIRWKVRNRGDVCRAESMPLQQVGQ